MKNASKTQLTMQNRNNKLSDWFFFSVSALQFSVTKLKLIRWLWQQSALFLVVFTVDVFPPVVIFRCKFLWVVHLHILWMKQRFLFWMTDQTLFSHSRWQEKKNKQKKDIGFPGSVVYLQARRGCTETISQLMSGAASMSTSFRVSNKSFRL